METAVQSRPGGGVPGNGRPRHGRLLSPEAARELATPFPERIMRSLRGGRREEALGLCGQMQDSQVLLHDFFADS